MKKITLSLTGLALLISLSGCGLSPINSLVELVQRGPVPQGYPVPSAGLACVVKVSHALGSSGVWLDKTMISPESWTEKEGSQRLVVVDDNSSAGMIFTVPNLTAGSVFQANENTISKGQDISVGYSYRSGLADYSFEDASSEAEVTIEGNQDGWIWGKFDGMLGTLRSGTLVIGKFTCRK